MSVAFRQPVLDPDATGLRSGGAAADVKPLCQPKASLFLMLAILWIFPSVGAAFILCASEAKWLHVTGILEGIRAVTFEQWIAVVILLAHPAFVWLAWRLRRTEPWKEIKPELDHDLQDPP